MNLGQPNFSLCMRVRARARARVCVGQIPCLPPHSGGVVRDLEDQFWMFEHDNSDGSIATGGRV